MISDPVSLMKTPQISAENESLRTFITSQIPKGAPLIRARDNDNTSLIRFADLNNDGKKEVIVFYETPDQAVQLHGSIFENKNGEWVQRITFDGEGKVLESLRFKDITNDGSIDIIAGFSRGDEELQSGLVVYTYQGKELEKALEVPYSHFVIDDLNDDGINDLTIVSLKRNELARMTTYQYENSFIELDKLELDKSVNSYYNVVAGKVSPDKRGIILDAGSGSSSGYWYSEMIVMVDNKLTPVLNDDQTYKDVQIYSEDVNADGIYEIGILETPKGWEHFSFDEIPWFYSYYQWDGKEGMTFVRQQYHDYKSRFFLNFFPPEWHNIVTIDTKSNKDEYLRFVMSDTNKTVAEIKFFSQQDWDKDHGGWDLLVRVSDKVIAYKSYDVNLELNKNKKVETDVAPIERKGNKDE
ncbi:FG-GAP-like repeat-containing protein [Paenibacillus glacialis]|nr:FG-GAP-like repeat-containing protein [Paenibacillus glacialis]